MKKVLLKKVASAMVCLGLLMPLSACSPTPAQSGATFDTIYQHILQSDLKRIAKTEVTQHHDVAWKNDVLDSKITVWNTKQPLDEVTISFSDFVSETGVTLPSSIASARWLKETQANLNRKNPDKPKMVSYPDIVHQGGSIHLNENELRSAWISLQIPVDAIAGTYSGTITLTSAEWETPLTLTTSFEVLDLTLPDATDFTTQIELWQHPFTSARYYGVEPFSDEHLGYLLPQLEEYCSLGGRSVIANIVEEAWNHQSYDSDPSMITWIRHRDGSFSFDYTKFDLWISAAIQVQILNPQENIGQIKCYSIVPWGNRITYYDEASDTIIEESMEIGSASWTLTWTSFLKDFMQHTMDYGWFEITYIAMDERPLEELSACIDLIESVQNENGDSFKISSAFNYAGGSDLDFLDRIDDISVGLAHIDDHSDDFRSLAEHRREKGLLTTIYTCSTQYPSSYTISDMADTTWSLWYSMKQKTDGFLRWSWDGWVENPLEDISYAPFEPGDPWLIYPAEKEGVPHVFYPSPRYLTLKQGVRDINKARILMSMSPELQQEINELVSSLKRPNARHDKYGNATYAKQSDRQLVLDEVIRMRDGLHEISRLAIERE